MIKVRNFWSKEECHEKALLCSSRNEFKNKYNSYYAKALKQKWKVFEDENVLQLEKELLSIGEPYQFTSPFDGHSEFRLLTTEEEQYIKSLIA